MPPPGGLLRDVLQPHRHRHPRSRVHQSGTVPGPVRKNRTPASRPERDQLVAGRRRLHLRVLAGRLRGAGQVLCQCDSFIGTAFSVQHNEVARYN